jgi:Uma2 family endonuclease
VDLIDGVPPGEHVPTADQRIVLSGVPWSHYEALLAVRGNASVPRISYLDGAMELVSPTREHERLKSVIGRLIEVYAETRAIELSAYGGWTLKDPAREAGAEPDECFVFGAEEKERPDLALEVVWTSGGIDKLEKYRRLGVPEVWFWIAGKISVHHLRADGYVESASSAFLPGIDLELLCSCLDRRTLSQSKAAFRAALAAAP